MRRLIRPPYAAMGALAGCPYLTCTDLSGAAAHQQMGDRARTMPAFLVQGTADPLNNLAMGQALVAQWVGTNDLGWKTYPHAVARHTNPVGCAVVENWVIHGLSHNYPGGDPEGTFTDPIGPDITTAAYEFFSRHSLSGPCS